MRRWVAGAVGLAVALSLAPRGDLDRANAMWAHAARVAGDDLGHPVWIDAVREARRIKPWQAGYRDQQARMHPVLVYRRSQLP